MTSWVLLLLALIVAWLLFSSDPPDGPLST